MKIQTTLLASAAAIAFAAAPAFAHHHHVTVRTPTGTPGEQLQLVVGYYEDELDLSIDPSSGQILDGDSTFVVALPTLIDSGPLAGMFTGDGLSLTSDFYAKEGVLNGGDMYYEMVAIVPVEGDPTNGAWCTTDEVTGEVNVEATSLGETRIERSLHVGVGGHPHGQILALAADGEYDVTLVAWDLNGIFLDSDPVVVRVHAHVPTPDFDGDGAVGAADLAFLLGAWGTHEADLNGDATTDATDLALLLGAWG